MPDFIRQSADTIILYGLPQDLDILEGHVFGTRRGPNGDGLDEEGNPYNPPYAAYGTIPPGDKFISAIRVIHKAIQEGLSMELERAKCSEDELLRYYREGRQANHNFSRQQIRTEMVRQDILRSGSGTDHPILTPALVDLAFRQSSDRLVEAMRADPSSKHSEYTINNKPDFE